MAAIVSRPTMAATAVVERATGRRASSATYVATMTGRPRTPAIALRNNGVSSLEGREPPLGRPLRRWPFGVLRRGAEGRRKPPTRGAPGRATGAASPRRRPRRAGGPGPPRGARGRWEPARSPRPRCVPRPRGRPAGREPPPVGPLLEPGRSPAPPGPHPAPRGRRTAVRASRAEAAGSPPWPDRRAAQAAPTERAPAPRR